MNERRSYLMQDGKSLESPGSPVDALGAAHRLTRSQLVDIRSHVAGLAPHARDRYFAELLLQLGDDLVSVQTALGQNQGAIKEFDASTRASLDDVRSTIKKFDESSSKLTLWLLGLTVVLVVLTFVIAGFTILLWTRG